MVEAGVVEPEDGRVPHLPAGAAGEEGEGQAAGGGARAGGWVGAPEAVVVCLMGGELKRCVGKV